MKTPDEIKKGLKCSSIIFDPACSHDCASCEYYIPNYPLSKLDGDALTYIQQLESRLAQAEREREAALHDFLRDTCEVCKHGETALDDCRAPYTQCKFEWRGVCPENTKEE